MTPSALRSIARRVPVFAAARFRAAAGTSPAGVLRTREGGGPVPA